MLLLYVYIKCNFISHYVEHKHLLIHNDNKYIFNFTMTI